MRKALTESPNESKIVERYRDEISIPDEADVERNLPPSTSESVPSNFFRDDSVLQCSVVIYQCHISSNLVELWILHPTYLFSLCPF